MMQVFQPARTLKDRLPSVTEDSESLRLDDGAGTGNRTRIAIVPR